MMDWVEKQTKTTSYRVSCALRVEWQIARKGHFLAMHRKKSRTCEHDYLACSA